VTRHKSVHQGGCALQRQPLEQCLWLVVVAVAVVVVVKAVMIMLVSVLLAAKAATIARTS
jgi:hypothetical protein